MNHGSLDPNGCGNPAHHQKIGQEKTVIFPTHILSEAEATCDRIVIINQGKIVADGNTADLKQSAGRQTTVQISLLNAAPEAAIKTFPPLTAWIRWIRQDLPMTGY
ncbi:MAG: hypothetical protein R2861_12875 [Desulfobacterales bacterium]